MENDLRKELEHMVAEINKTMFDRFYEKPLGKTYPLKMSESEPKELDNFTADQKNVLLRAQNGGVVSKSYGLAGLGLMQATENGWILTEAGEKTSSAVESMIKFRKAAKEGSEEVLNYRQQSDNWKTRYESAEDLRQKNWDRMQLAHAIFEDIQWCKDGYCPDCGNLEDEGHSDNCRIQQYFNEYG